MNLQLVLCKKALIAHGANIEAKDDMGFASLAIAAEFGHLPVVQVSSLFLMHNILYNSSM